LVAVFGEPTRKIKEPRSLRWDEVANSSCDLIKERTMP
jgi:hypothetical protein